MFTGHGEINIKHDKWTLDFFNVYIHNTLYFLQLIVGCSDKDNRCRYWTRYCRTNPYVQRNCKKTCRLPCWKKMRLVTASHFWSVKIRAVPRGWEDLKIKEMTYPPRHLKAPFFFFFFVLFEAVVTACPTKCWSLDFNAVNCIMRTTL